MSFMGYFAFFLSFFVAGWICKKLNRNTIGTTGAYIKRYIIVWFFTALVLVGITNGVF